MRTLFRSARARCFLIAIGLVFSAAMAPPSALAQTTCNLSGILQQVVGDLRGTAGGAISTGGEIIAATAPELSATNRAVVRLLSGVAEPLVEVPSPVTNPPPQSAPSQPARDPTKPSDDQEGGTAGRLVSTVCNTVQGLSAQSGIAALATVNLTGAILARLDGLRGGAVLGMFPTSGGGTDGQMSLGAARKATPAPPSGTTGPFTVFASGTLLGGNASDLPDTAGFSYAGGTGMVGLEYSVNRNLILGVAGSFTTVDADLNTGANVGADLVHGTAYLSYATRAWFVDALAAYGAVNLDLARPGTSEPVVRGSTDGTALAAAARSGYLFDFGKVRAGPIAGLTYVRARIDGYTEAGSDPSALAVGAQTVESLTGSAGVRVLAPFQAGGNIFVPYLNVTLEHQFGDDSAELTTSLAGSGGTQPVTVSFPTFGARDYGKVEGGLTVELAPAASVSLSGASTFARDDGQDYRVSAGLNYRF
jgi:outer membrane lipase/esterase